MKQKQIILRVFSFVVIYAITICILAVLSLLVVSFNTKAKEKPDDVIAIQSQWENHTELYWQDVIQSEIGGEKEFKLDDNTRVDILLDEWACEIDWQNKWAEGIGQSIYYGLKTNRKPLVILLAKKDGWEKYRDRVEYCKIECWVYDTRLRQWIDK